MSDSCIVWTVWLETILISCSCSGAIFVWRRAAEAAVFVQAMKRVIGFGVVSVLVVENAVFRRPFRTAPPMLPWGLLVVVYYRGMGVFTYRIR